MGWMLLDRIMGGFITGFIATVRWWPALLAAIAGAMGLILFAG
jgi:hypothetical protein